LDDDSGGAEVRRTPGDRQHVAAGDEDVDGGTATQLERLVDEGVAVAGGLLDQRVTGLQERRARRAMRPDRGEVVPRGAEKTDQLKGPAVGLVEPDPQANAPAP
jgi:hypothetical protein